MTNDIRHSVLLVEDDPQDAQLAMTALRENRIANPLIYAQDGEKARDYLFGIGNHTGRDVSIRPELVLLDFDLPGLGGLDLLRRIRADDRTRSLSVVVLTSSDEEEHAVRDYRLGANAYARKPLDAQRLRTAIDRLTLHCLLLSAESAEMFAPLDSRSLTT